MSRIFSARFSTDIPRIGGMVRFNRRHCSLLRAALAVAFIALAGCSSGDAPQQAAAPPATVTVHEVVSSQWVDSVDALGTAQAKESVTLTAKVTEVVRKVRFEDGDRVNQGDVLVELTGQAEVANLREAQAELNETQQQLTRLEPLVESGTIPRAQIDTQRAARDSARARADSIRARLAERVITAPFSGVLGFRQVSDGALVAPGTVIAVLDDTSTIKLDFSVPEVLLATLSAGQSITAKSIAYPDTEFTGVVSSVGSRVDPVTRAVTVRADVPNPEGLIKPGMLMSVELMTRPRQAIVIPELSLIQVGMRQSVFRVSDDGTVEQVPVQTGARRRGEVEVLDGLAAGDRIVLEGTGKLRGGMTVAVVDEAAAPSPDAEPTTPTVAPTGRPAAAPAGG
jgi:membrane fusion protein (multidrug efflux system)